MTMTRRTVLGGAGAAALLPWRALAKDTHRPPIIAPIGLEAGRLLIAGSINRSAPLIFLIDTGAVASLISETVAEALKLDSIGRRQLSGAGGRGGYTAYGVRELIIGGAVRVPNAEFIGIPGDGLGEGIAGTLSAGLLTAYDSVIDFDRSEWRLYRDGLDDRAGFIRIDSHIRQPSGNSRAGYLFADAVLDGKKYRFLLDTGAPGAVMLYKDAARHSALSGDARPYAPVRRRGLGGAGPLGRVVRGGALTIGPCRFDRPLVLLDGGDGFASEADGVIGLPILRQMNLATDVKRKILWVERDRLPPPPQIGSLSGLWIDRKGDAPIIADVGRGSPAMAAGLMPGDRIVGITLPDIVKRIAGPAGRSLPLTIERDGQRRTVTLVLRAYL